MLVNPDNKLKIQFATVEMQVRWNHPGKHSPHTLQVIYASNANMTKSKEAIDWLLLTNEPVTLLKMLKKILGHYGHRWRTEEWLAWPATKKVNSMSSK